MSDEATTITTARPRMRRIVWFLFVTLIIIGSIVYGYYRLSRTGNKLAHAVSTLQDNHANQAESMATLESRVDALTDKVNANAENSANEIALLKAETAGDKTRLALFEAEYLVNLANDELLYANNGGMALVLLTRAEQLMNPLEGLDFAGIKQALANNIAALKASPMTNTSGLYAALNAINVNLDQLPLPANPLKSDEASSEDKVNVDGLPWWKAQWRRTMHTLGKVVIVRYNGSATPPLVLPEERVFIYQNMHAQMENVFWAVLNHNAQVYQAALLRLHAWINQYFDTQSPMTQSTLEQISQLSQAVIATPEVNTSETLKQFSDYFNNTVSVKAAS